MSADRNLLFGLLALHNGFVTREQLLEAVSVWSPGKPTPLGAVLRARGVLYDNDVHLLDSLVDRHLAKHGDVHQSLAALPHTPELSHALSAQTPGTSVPLWEEPTAPPAPTNPGRTVYSSETPPIGPSAHTGATGNGPRYRILRPHARGGLGEVSVALDVELHREVALKQVQDRFADNKDIQNRFLREAEITGRLEHPGIVPVYGLVTPPGGQPTYAMRLIHGERLHDAITRYHQSAPGEPSPALRELLTRFVAACHAVAYAHSRGVIHRDLKPHNVMLGDFGETLVVDWGLAKVLTESDPEPTARHGAIRLSDTDVTELGQVMGTPAYLPPEQARGVVDQVDRRSDVFGLGAILCEILTGQPPYTGPTAEAVLQRAAEADLEEARGRLRGCGADPELIRLTERCLAPRREDRPADGGAVAAAVSAYFAGVEERLQQERLERERQEVRAIEERRRRRLWLGLAAAVLAFVGLAAGGGMYWQGQRNQRHAEATFALEQAEGHLRAGQFAAAKDSLTHARDRLGGGSAALVDRYNTLQTAWQFVGDLNEIQRKRTTPTAEGLFDNESAQKSYVEKFAEAGYDLTSGDPEELAHRIRASPVAAPILAAIDNWALVCEYDVRFVPDRKDEYEQLRDRLLTVARLADPDPDLRDKIRSTHVRNDRRQLEQLATQALSADLSPRLAGLLAELLRLAKGDPEPLLRAFQSRHPGDFWLNFDLAKQLDQTRPAEALRYYQAALAVGPHNVFVYNRMGSNLSQRCYWDEAVATCQMALALTKDPMLSIGIRNELAVVLSDKGDLENAMALLHENVRLAPNQAGVHLNLGVGYARSGRFVKALESFRRGQQLAVQTRSHLRKQAEEMLREGERQVDLERRLEAGNLQSANAEEADEIADVCFSKKRYGDAVRYYRRMFELDPKQTAAVARYQPACAAVLAAAADPSRRAELHKQALTWLREDLALWTRRVANPKLWPRTEAELRRWRQHPNLESVRDAAAVARLPADEQQAWQRFWADVNALLARVQAQ